MGLTVLRVFAREDGGGGNPLGVYLDGSEVPRAERQARAAQLGFSETVFVDDSASGELQIYTPATELAFAGHPLVGAAWLLGCDVLRPPAGEVPTWTEGGDRWIRARPGWAPEFELRRHGSAAEVDVLSPPARGNLDAWAWIDEGRGLIRSRVFAPDLGVPEDEATGAAATRLVEHLGLPIEIRQGQGSRLLARPGPDGTAEIGGRVVRD